MSSKETLTSVAAGNLRAEMARQRKTSADLADALNCSQSSASRRMTGETVMDLDELAAIANWLQVNTNALLSKAAA